MTVVGYLFLWQDAQSAEQLAQTATTSIVGVLAVLAFVTTPGLAWQRNTPVPSRSPWPSASQPGWWSA